MVQLEDVAKNATSQYMQINETAQIFPYGRGHSGEWGWLNADKWGGDEKLAKPCGRLLWMAPI